MVEPLLVQTHNSVLVLTPNPLAPDPSAGQKRSRPGAEQTDPRLVHACHSAHEKLRADNVRLQADNVRLQADNAFMLAEKAILQSDNESLQADNESLQAQTAGQVVQMNDLSEIVGNLRNMLQCSACQENISPATKGSGGFEAYVCNNANGEGGCWSVMCTTCFSTMRDLAIQKRGTGDSTWQTCSKCPLCRTLWDMEKPHLHFQGAGSFLSAVAQRCLLRPCRYREAGFMCQQEPLLGLKMCDHERKCGLQHSMCPHVRCHVAVRRSEMAQHMETCEQKFVRECENTDKGCLSVVDSRCPEQHVCLYKDVKCPTCGDLFPRKDLWDHLLMGGSPCGSCVMTPGEHPPVPEQGTNGGGQGYPHFAKEITIRLGAHSVPVEGPRVPTVHLLDNVLGDGKGRIALVVMPQFYNSQHADRLTHYRITPLVLDMPGMSLYQTDQVPQSPLARAEMLMECYTGGNSSVGAHVPDMRTVLEFEGNPAGMLAPSFDRWYEPGDAPPLESLMQFTIQVQVGVKRGADVTGQGIPWKRQVFVRSLGR